MVQTAADGTECCAAADPRSPLMRHFLRALRFAWPYRYRLFISGLCALFAAACWSLNFTAIYPVLKILGGDQNLQEWVDTSIHKVTTEQIKPLRKELSDLEAGKQILDKMLQTGELDAD